MRVLLISPSIPPEPTGNAATAGRLAASLGRLGVEVVLSRALSPGADLVHVHHLVKSGRLLLGARDLPPVVASAGGTDLLPLPPEDARIRDAVMALARRILAPTEEGLDALAQAHPASRTKCRLVPRGVSLPSAGKTISLMFNLQAAAGAAPADVLFFLPAGFRSVKRNALALGPLGRLRARGLGVRLVASGPVLEPQAASAFDALAGGLDWTRRTPPFPAGAIGATLSGADVVLNTSAHEGMSNAVLEAMLAGRAVLASDIPGNRAAVRDGETGLLFRDEAEFEVKAERLVRDPALRERLGRSAREEARTHFSAEAEALAVLAAYREALGVL